MYDSTDRPHLYVFSCKKYWVGRIKYRDGDWSQILVSKETARRVIESRNLPELYRHLLLEEIDLSPLNEKRSEIDHGFEEIWAFLTARQDN